MEPVLGTEVYELVQELAKYLSIEEREKYLILGGDSVNREEAGRKLHTLTWQSKSELQFMYYG